MTSSGENEGGATPDAAGIASGGALWHGRFAAGPAESLMAFTESLSFDRRLLPDDIRASKAHVRGLARGGLLDDAERDAVIHALDRVEREDAAGDLVAHPDDEDVHTLIERRVTELAGPAGAKLHTGRSRNDQVATAFRLWARRNLADVRSGCLVLANTLLASAERYGPDGSEVRLPGYTHLQRAQPVMLAHHLAAHAWALLRDAERLDDWRRRADVSPLGAGALAGSSLALDPGSVAAELGFAATFENSLDATSDRDWVAEAVFVLAMIGVHLSRMGEEIVLWSSEEFGFVRLDDAHSTGSSMLPQKKNPDIAELARGKSGRLIGNLTGLMATLKGLPLAYNRDLQEDKEPLFDSVDTVVRGLSAMDGLFASLTVHGDVMRDAADAPGAVATDLAEFLVGRGVPFRDAHALVGALVRRSLDDGVPLVELVAADASLGPDAAALFEPGASVRNRTTAGAAGPDAVRRQLIRLRSALTSAEGS